MQRFTRQLLLWQLCAAVLMCLLAGLWGHLRWPLAALTGVAAVLLARVALTANNFAIAWRYHSETPPDYRLTILQTCALFLREFYATMWNSSWAMPFKRFGKRDIAHANGLPVLLIHGYGCNSGYWDSLSTVLTRANVTHHAIDLEPILADIDSYVPAIDAAIETLCRDGGRNGERASIVIVAHSMGGLAARAYLRDHGAARVAQLITLGTPHHGTGIANYGAGANSRQMRWSGSAKNGAPSAWLRKLDEGESAAVRARIVSIYSHHDNIISPQTSAHLDGARNLEYQGIGHVALALHPQIQARVLAEIRNASAQTLMTGA